MHFPKILPFLFLFLAALVPTVARAAADWPEVVARVEGHAIHRDELATQAEILRARVVRSGQGDPSGDPAFYRTVLEGLIGEVLVYADAKQRGAAASPAEIEAALGRMQSRFDDPAAFDAALAAQNTSRAEVREQLERTITIEKVLAEIGSRIRLDDGAARKFWEQNQEALRTPEQRRARHILLVPEGEGGWSKARTQGELLREQLLDGADFADLAKRHSDDEASAARGGELGWVESGSASGTLAEAALAMEPGKGPVVVETEDGVHVLGLMEVRPSRVPSFEESGERIEGKLRDYLVQLEVERRTAELREGAEVQIFLGS